MLLLICMHHACRSLRLLLEPLDQGALTGVGAKRLQLYSRNEVRCFGLFLSWTLSQSSSVLVDFVRENVVVAAKHGRLSGAHFEPIHAPTSARTPPPASMRPASAHCMGILIQKVQHRHHLDCPYFEGAAATLSKSFIHV